MHSITDFFLDLLYFELGSGMIQVFIAASLNCLPVINDLPVFRVSDETSLLGFVVVQWKWLGGSWMFRSGSLPVSLREG